MAPTQPLSLLLGKAPFSSRSSKVSSFGYLPRGMPRRDSPPSTRAFASSRLRSPDASELVPNGVRNDAAHVLRALMNDDPSVRAADRRCGCDELHWEGLPMQAPAVNMAVLIGARCVS